METGGCWGPVAAPGAAAAVGCWLLANGKCLEIARKFNEIHVYTTQQHVSKYMQLHKHMVEYSKMKQKTHEKTLS